MRMNITGLPAEIYADDKWWKIQHRTNGWLRVDMTPNARSTEWIEAKNMTELKAKINNVLAAKKADRELVKARKQALEETVLVDAYVGEEEVKVRGQHATTGDWLVTFPDGRKDSAKSLMSIQTDIRRWSALANELSALGSKRYEMQKGYYEAARELEDETIEVTYHSDTDMFRGAYKDYTITCPDAFQVLETITMQVVAAKYPWALKRKEKIDAIVPTKSVEKSNDLDYLFATKEEAQEYLDTLALHAQVQQALWETIVPFDYDAELKRATARS